jgi:hypothetical protein
MSCGELCVFKIRRSPIGLRTKTVQDAFGQPIVVRVGLLDVFWGWIRRLWAVSRWLRSAVSTAAISVVVSLAIGYWMADKNNVAAGAESHEADTREFICKVSADNSEFFICQVHISTQDQGIAGANDSAASNADADKQLSLEGSDKPR